MLEEPAGELHSCSDVDSRIVGFTADQLVGLANMFEFQ